MSWLRQREQYCISSFPFRVRTFGSRRLNFVRRQLTPRFSMLTSYFFSPRLTSHLAWFCPACTSLRRVEIARLGDEFFRHIHLLRLARHRSSWLEGSTTHASLCLRQTR